MKKSIKILSILFVTLLFVVSFSYATDINMNLQSVNDSQTLNTSYNNSYSNNASQNTTSGQTSNNSTVLSSTSSTTVSTSSSNSDEGLSFTNILNILLIVVGIVLILLGVAILIRMKS